MEEKRNILNKKIEESKADMSTNPFSQHFQSTSKMSKDDPNYGKPPVGSKSESRGLKAAAHINAEVALLCSIIYEEGQRFEDGTAVISFGHLFQLYTVISNKLVGTLLRGRRHGFIEFQGEILFQRRDDEVPIYLKKPIKQIKEELASDTEFEVGLCHKSKMSM